MQYKAKVIRRFPNAEPIVMEQWPDGSPRRVVIHADGPNSQRLTTTLHDQSFKGAWRDAYYWCVRHPTQEYRELAARHGIPVAEG